MRPAVKVLHEAVDLIADACTPVPHRGHYDMPAPMTRPVMQQLTNLLLGLDHEREVLHLKLMVNDLQAVLDGITERAEIQHRT